MKFKEEMPTKRYKDMVHQKQILTMSIYPLFLFCQLCSIYASFFLKQRKRPKCMNNDSGR